MLPKIVTSNGAGVDVEAVSHGPLHPSGVEQGPGADDVFLRQAGHGLVNRGNHVDGVGNDHDFTVKATLLNLLGNCRNLLASEWQFSEPVGIWVVLELNVAQGRDDDVGVLELLVIIDINIGVMKQVCHRILEVQRVGVNLICVAVNQHQVIREAIRNDVVSNCGTDMAHPDNCYFPCH